MEVKQKHWSAELLTIFGLWLWKQEEYGHALLSIHGPHWGFKIGDQLKITWDNLLGHDDREPLIYVDVPTDKDDNCLRRIEGVTRVSILKAHNELDFEYWDDTIYMNYKTGKPLTTSTLNRELQKFAKQFIAEMEQTLGKKLNLKPLKSNAFQIAWALRNLARYNYSKRCFVEVSKFMGHRTLKDTIALLDVEPNDNIVFDFSEVFNDTQFNYDVLNDETKLWLHTRYALKETEKNEETIKD